MHTFSQVDVYDVNNIQQLSSVTAIGTQVHVHCSLVPKLKDSLLHAPVLCSGYVLRHVNPRLCAQCVPGMLGMVASVHCCLYFSFLILHVLPLLPSPLLALNLSLTPTPALSLFPPSLQIAEFFGYALETVDLNGDRCICSALYCYMCILYRIRILHLYVHVYTAQNFSDYRTYICTCTCTVYIHTSIVHVHAIPGCCWFFTVL